MVATDSTSNSTERNHAKHNFYSLRSSRNKLRCKRRIILKNGDYNVIFSQESNRSKLKLVQDSVNFLVKVKWSWTIATFTAILVASFLTFGVIYWIICQTHGDLELHHLPQFQEQYNFTPCIRQIYDFRSCILFSLETQHTVGYGTRAPTEECPEAVFVGSIHCIFGDLLRGFMTGIIFAKITLPKKRTSTLLFSRNAVVCMRDGLLCFMFRVGDLRKDKIIDVEVKAYLIRTVKTREGEVLRQHQSVLEVTADDCREDVNLIWPLVVVHKIDGCSPLNKLSPSHLLSKNLEIVVVVEGLNEDTGQSVQAMSSYHSSEILWGRKFCPILNYDSDWRLHVVDFSLFHETEPAFTPLCSAQHLLDCINETEIIESPKTTNAIDDEDEQSQISLEIAQIS